MRLLDVNTVPAGKQWGPSIPRDRAMSLRLEQYVAGRGAYEGGSTNNRLVIPAISDDPHYRVLLFPFRHGHSEPVTKFDNGTLLVRLRGQEDVYQLGLLADGRTVFSLTRNGKGVFSMREFAMGFGGALDSLDAILRVANMSFYRSYSRYLGQAFTERGQR